MIYLKKVIILFACLILLIYTNIDIKNNNINKNVINDVPTINLKGEKNLKLKVGEEYIEPGYFAYDKIDGDITKNVNIISDVDIYIPGNYQITYKVANSNGIITTTIRYIDILSELDINKKTIYLTFDDGPSNITKDVLNILKEENIKATFFVINTDSKYDYLIKQIYDDGHTIGLHSYSHNYSNIYKSTDAYLNDLEKIKDKVIKLTNYKSNIIRFPGGSSNTISNVSMNLLIKEINNLGYYYYDWNIASYDTSNISSNRIYNKIINQLNNHNYNTNIILMHDFQNNNKILSVLKKLIKYGKENGYNFSNISKYTPLVRHKY